MLSEDKRIKSKAQLKEFLDIECARYPLYGRRCISYLLQLSEGAILRRHTVLLRKTEYYINTGKKIRGYFYWARLMRFQNKHCIRIPINCCDKGLYIAHVYPTGMNGNVTVGKNCRMMPYAKIAGDDVLDKTPVIGDNVTLGIDCIVFGDVTLADGITVGAGAVVTKSFLEPGISIAGVPARKIEK